MHETNFFKHRLNAGQELVVDGYFPGTYGVDAIIVGFTQRGSDLRRSGAQWLRVRFAPLVTIDKPLPIKPSDFPTRSVQLIELT